MNYLKSWQKGKVIRKGISLFKWISVTYVKAIKIGGRKFGWKQAIIKYKSISEEKHLNIGIIIFGVIFIYLVVTVLMYLTENIFLFMRFGKDPFSKTIPIPVLPSVMKQ